MSQKNALSESSSCKQQPRGDQVQVLNQDVLNMISPKAAACRMMILKVRFFLGHPVCVFYISKFVIDLFKTCYLICCYLVWALDLFCSRILENKGTIILQRNWFTNKFDRKLKSCALKLWTSFSVGYSVAMSGDNDDDDDDEKCFSSVLLHQPLCQSITCNWLI